MENEKLLFTFEEVSHMAEISESMVRKLVRKGQIEVVRIGRAIRVPRQALLRLCGTGTDAEVKQ